MKNNIMNLIKKNKFITMLMMVVILVIILIIPVYAAPAKYIVYGEMQEGYIEKVDETNFNDVYNGNYPNVRVYDRQSMNISAIKHLNEDLLLHAGFSPLTDTIIARTDDANAPKISYDVLVYNNYADQKLYDAVNDITLNVYAREFTGGYSYGADIRNYSNSVLQSRDDYEMEKRINLGVAVKITLHSSVTIDESLLANSYFTFENLTDEELKFIEDSKTDK